MEELTSNNQVGEEDLGGDDLYHSDSDSHSEMEDQDGTQANRSNQEAIEDDIGGDDLYRSTSDTEEEPEEMWLSEEEANWARALKRAVEEDSGFRPLSDFDYVNYSMVAKGNVEEALRCIRNIQLLRDTYNVKDTPEDFLPALKQYLQDQPGFFIHVDVSKDTGTSFVVYVFKQYDPDKALETEANWRTQILALYYIVLLQQPTLRSIREGMYFILEAKGTTWDNFNLELETRLAEEFSNAIPIRHKSIMVYNSHSVVNVAFALMKPLMKQEERDKIHLGCRCDFATLSDMYLQPSYEVAMERLVNKATELLTLRYRNSRDFRL